MLHITADQVTPSIRSLFRTDEPQARRCFAVLDGAPPAGKIIVDDLDHPTWAVVQEIVDRSLYLGGETDASAFGELFAGLRREGDVLVGLWPDDPRIGLLPPDPAYDGRTVEFYDRPVGEGLDRFLRQAPSECRIERIDRELVMRTEWGPGDVRMLGSIDAWEKNCFGYVLMQGDQILSESSVGAPALGLYEPGVFTHPDHRGKGYGTMVTARLVQEIEAMGGQTYWNCAKQNLASAAIARRLGYRVEKEYRCMVWRKTEIIQRRRKQKK